VSRYYTSPEQLARRPEITGRPVEWLECDECDGAGFYIDWEDDEPELCEMCMGRGGEWGIRMADVVLSCNCGECGWCRKAGAA
jgi:hypothetical protein